MWSELKLRLFAREDSEHVQILIRIGIVAFVTVFLEALDRIAQKQSDAGLDIYVALALSMFISLALLAWVIISPRSNPLRRLLAALQDNFFLTVCLVLRGEAAALCYGLYLFITLGYGFRYGTRYLRFSQALSLVGFIVVWEMSPFWHANPVLSASLLLTLAVIPSYAVTLIQTIHAEKARAEAHSRAKSDFVAMMSHEFRTPLHGIIGHTELLEHTKLNAEQSGYLRRLRASTAGLLDLVESVLDISRIEEGKQSIVKAEVSLKDLLIECVSTIEVQAKSKDLRLQIYVDPVLPDKIIIDRRSVREILLNLMGNAVKFTDSGSIELTVSHGALNADSLQVVFQVCDSGIGIAEEHFDRVFERFNQVHGSADRAAAGAGLGTTIALDLARRMGGDLRLQSELGRGSSFNFDVPVQGGIRQRSKAINTQQVLLIGVFQDIEHGPLNNLNALGFETKVLAQLDVAIDYIRANGTSTQWVFVPESIGIPAATRVADALQAAAPSVLKNGRLISVTNVSACSSDLLEKGYSGSLRFGATLSETAALLAGQLPAETSATDEENSQGAIEADELGNAKAALAQQQYLRVLLVDDNSVNRLMMSTWFDKLGIEHAVASTGYEFLEMAADGSFDLFMIDHQMPDLDGIEALNLYRTAAADPLMPAVLVSADVRTETVSRALRAGFTSVVPKPLKLDLLIKAMVEAFVPQSERTAVSNLDLAGTQSTAEHSTKYSEGAQFRDDAEVLIDPAHLLGVTSIAKAEASVFAQKLIQAYENDAKEVFVNLRKTLSNHNFPDLWDAAHALKGNSMNIGALAAAALCAQLENMRPEDLTQHGDHLLDALENTVSRSVAALRAANAQDS